MKKITVLLLTLVFLTFAGFSQTNKDTSSKQIKKIEKRIIIMTDDGEQENIEIESDGPMCGGKEMFNENCGNSCKKHMQFIKKDKHGKKKLKATHRLYPMTHTKKIFALMPVILFLFVFIIFFFWLRRENFKLSDALSSKAPEVLKTTNTRQDPNDPSKTITEIKEEIYYSRSTSKLIAFLTAIAGIVVVICGLSFHAYTMLSGIGAGGNNSHHGGGMLIMVFVLLIGMLPYIFRAMFKK
ncbi:MAG: hypothetical protein HY951_02205 [Bacteroidia bacterium]|nr:hypothetical protein [Bacteroidia bacterium]